MKKLFFHRAQGNIGGNLPGIVCGCGAAHFGIWRYRIYRWPLRRIWPSCSVSSQRSKAFLPRSEAHFAAAIPSGGAAHLNARWIWQHLLSTGDGKRKAAIIRANRYVVDHVDYLIAYAWHPASNARELVEYAKRRVKKGSLFITVIKHNDSTWSWVFHESVIK